MPTYAYRCGRGHEFEVEQRITDEPLARCPATFHDVPCDHTVRRQLYAPVFTLKGGGWYADGYTKG